MLSVRDEGNLGIGLGVLEGSGSLRKLLCSLQNEKEGKTALALEGSAPENTAVSHGILPSDSTKPSP